MEDTDDQDVILETFEVSSVKDIGRNESHTWIDMEGTIRIPLYGFIFISGLVGNILIIVTLARNRRLRVVTNVFLLNLAVSDLLLGVFCMPFTLVGALLREFIFGEAMCKIITYLQSVTVAVNAWTLVSISMERFYAVCEPLRSRRWQTSTHACKVIIGIWLSSLSIMLPVAWVNVLQPTNPPGKFKCREVWPSDFWERAFNIFMDTTFLAIPLLIMIIAYFRIGLVLRREIPQNQICQPGDNQDPSVSGGAFLSQMSVDECILCKPQKFTVRWSKVKVQTQAGSTRSTSVTSGVMQSLRHHGSCADNSAVVTLSMNTCNLERRIAIKKKVTCMLFVVVLEFFLCWTPIYVVNTIYSFDREMVYQQVGYFTISCFHLLSYISSCCNPITYCFMNRNFRREFIQTFTRACFLLKSTSSTQRHELN